MSIRKGNDIIAGTLNTSTYYTKSDIDSLSNGLVHKSGTETISGVKTFSSTIKSTIRSVTVPNNVISVSHDQLADSFVDLIGLYDSKNNCRCATIRAYNTPTMHGIILGGNSFSNGAPTGIAVQYDSSDNLTTTAHTPTSTNANNTEIATTQWVKSLLNNHYITAFQAPNSSDNYKWYRKYADGWVEQGGLLGSAGTYAWRTVTLPVTMANNAYTVVITGAWNDASGNGSMLGNSKTTTGFNTYATNVNNEGSFYVCGMYAT